MVRVRVAVGVGGRGVRVGDVVGGMRVRVGGTRVAVAEAVAAGLICVGEGEDVGRMSVAAGGKGGWVGAGGTAADTVTVAMGVTGATGGVAQLARSKSTENRTQKRSMGAAQRHNGMRTVCGLSGEYIILSKGFERAAAFGFEFKDAKEGVARNKIGDANEEFAGEESRDTCQ